MAAPNDWWPDWVTYHSLLFGMDSEREVETFRLWRAVFAVALRATLDEMKNVSRLLTQRKPMPRFRSDQLAGLQELLLELRRRAVQYDRNVVNDDLGTCTICGSSGMAIVPHLRAVQDGIWTHRTAEGRPCHTTAVLCRCALGVWLQQRNKRQQMTLDEYERFNPHWKDQLQADAVYRKAHLRAVSGTQELDRIRGMPGVSSLSKSLDEVTPSS